MRSATSGGFDFDDWFQEFVISAEARRRLAVYGQKYGLRHHDLDDLRQDWYLRVSATVRRSGLPATVSDAQQATPYVLVAARRAAHDLACRGMRAREDVWTDTHESGRSIFDGPDEEFVGRGSTTDHEPAAGPWCDRIRARISRRLHARSVQCPGCRGAEVAQFALEIVNQLCEAGDDEVTLEPWIAALRGGATEFAKLMYQAIETVTPGRLDVDPEGRVSARGRAYKKRCEPCVVELLTEVMTNRSGHTGSSGVADTPGDTETDPR